jgi:hypothetical protein
METTMKTVAEDKDTITIQFTREEARNVNSSVNYVSDLFEFLDREALDGYQMTAEEAEQLADELTELTTSYVGRSRVAGRT